MASFLPFMEPEDCDNIQIVVLTGIYGWVLFSAAGMIGDGSELLLLVPSLAGMVGSIVLPVLGAVPDGMMVLFSGLGPRMDAQEQLAVGIGALAGSTIMLLTIPWFLAIYGGRVSFVKGKPNYAGKPKLLPGDGITETGVMVGPAIASTSVIMLLTCCLYGIVQVPALMANDDFPKHMSPMEVFDAQAAQVNFYAMVGFVACTVFFFAYLGYQFMNSDAGHDEKSSNLKVAAIRSGQVTLRGVMHGMIESASVEGQLMDISEKEKNSMKDILRPFFQHYDNDNNQILSKYEFGKIMADLKEDLTQEAEMALFDSADVDKSGAIDFEEFCSLMVRYTKNELLKEQTRGATKTGSKGLTNGAANGSNGAVNDAGDAGEEDEEEEEEMPDDLKDLSPEEQQSAIKARACWMMGFGTVLVLIFSDPAVGVLSDIGRRTNISAFYISFVLAPLASNASELVAAYNYGCKKTQAMMTISLSTLLGAGCMNNTFCLAIFFMLIWKQKLTWNYTAEVTSIVFIQVVVGLFAMKQVQMVTDSIIVLLMYPLSIIIVWAMQNILKIP